MIEIKGGCIGGLRYTMFNKNRIWNISYMRYIHYNTSKYIDTMQTYERRDFHEISRIVCIGRMLRISQSGGRLNKKDGLTRYGDSLVKDKTT